MKIVTKEDYIKSLRDLKANIYYNGRKVEDATAIRASSPTSTRRPRPTSWPSCRSTKI